jgi:hypothetical protein
VLRRARRRRLPALESPAAPPECSAVRARTPVRRASSARASRPPRPLRRRATTADRICPMSVARAAGELSPAAPSRRAGPGVLAAAPAPGCLAPFGVADSSRATQRLSAQMRNNARF